ncbi:MAG: ATP-binding cassette domain-containing protein [Peptococcaceae bacterium]|nr:ATP-binding cassette domain-containing protein [Peptococcaceae bacterium]
MIEVRNLVKRYGDRLAVDNLSFTAEKGRIYGFLGPNGAGKTTTMNIMTGYLGPTSGDVIVDGRSMLEEPEEVKRYIGYLPENPPLYIDMTVSEYLTFAAELKKIPKSRQKSEIQKAVEYTFLQDVNGRLIRNLSKGYRQRVGLAQAILGFPEIIILDEPTVGLDPKQIMEIRDLIRNLGREHTVIFSSHILSEVQEVCDHVLIIHHGKLLANGTPEELERQMKNTTLELTVRSSSPEQVKNMLVAIPGIVSVAEDKNDQPGQVSLKIETEPDTDPRDDIFYACAENRNPILTLRGLDMSLEQIFLSLTTDNVQPASSSVLKQFGKQEVEES